MKKIIFTLTALYIGIFALTAQSDRFKAGIFAGINLTQLDGDRQQGYDCRMPAVGLRSAIILNKRFDIGTELIYNGRGAKPTDEDFRRVKTPSITIKMQYADVMLTGNWHYHLTEAGFFRSTLTAGLYYGRLLQSTSEVYINQRIDTVLSAKVAQSNLKSSDLGFMLGWSYRFTPKLGLAIRHTASFGYAYVNPNYEQLRLTVTQQRLNEYLTLQSYFLSAHVFYDFISPKLKKKKTAKKKGD